MKRLVGLSVSAVTGPNMNTVSPLLPDVWKCDCAALYFINRRGCQHQMWNRMTNWGGSSQLHSGQFRQCSCQAAGWTSRQLHVTFQQGRRFCCFAEHPIQICGPPCLLFNGYCGCFPHSYSGWAWSWLLTSIRGVFRPRQTRQLPRVVDLKGWLLSCQSY